MSKKEIDESDSFDCGYHLWAKEQHKKRVAKNPNRLEYAIKRLLEEKIPYKVKNASITHIHAYDSEGNVHQFWAGTGKILWSVKARKYFPSNERDVRGIENFIKYLKREKYKGGEK